MMGAGDREGDTATGPNGEKAIFQGGKWKVMRSAVMGGGGAMDPDTANYVAQQYRLTGQLPNLGMGGAGAKMGIIKRAAQLDKAQGQTGEDAVTRHATVKAATGALVQNHKVSTAIAGFEGAARRNADLALGLLDKGGGPTKITTFNRWIQAGRKETGDPDVHAFHLAVGTLADEYAKVVTGNGGGGGAASTDSARHEAYQRLNRAASPAAFRKTVETMKQEMSNRLASNNEQRTVITNSIRAAGQAPTPAAQPPQVPKRPALADIFK